MSCTRVNLIVIALAAAGLMVTGCSTGSGFTGHSIDTQVRLSEGNFQVIDTVSGEASATSVLGIGLDSEDLQGRAKRKMIEDANLEGGPRAVINVTTDVEFTTYVLVTTRTVYVTAEVIEFTN